MEISQNGAAAYKLTEAILGDAQKAMMQSKIEGLEQQLTNDSRNVAQKDLAIMELSQSLRRIESAISHLEVALIYLYKHRVLHQWYQTLQLLHFQAIHIQQ